MSTRLIGAPDANAPWFKRPRPLLVNFLAMAFCFSLNHGTVPTHVLHHPPRWPDPRLPAYLFTRCAALCCACRAVLYCIGR
jgi:hypothetical protein